LVYDTQTQTLEKHFLSLTGTIRNCAGGLTPWNTWITCEETIQKAEETYEVAHGYNFEVPVSADIKLADPIPLKAMGRFNHEAVAVDPRTGIVYQTEDRGDSLIYRFIPDTPGELAAGGKLQALKIRDMKSADTRNWRSRTQKIFRWTYSPIPVGETLVVEWVDIENVESPDDDLRVQGADGKDAAKFARGEGIWYGSRQEQGEFYIACTNGGIAYKGQIWRYIPSPYEGTSREEQQPGTLQLFIEPNDSNLMENADNLTVTPWGDLIICEDGPNEEFLIGVTPEGNLYRFARNAGNLSELAGATFSPDGTTLFVNIQSPGITLAITGPWHEIRQRSDTL
jgi:secreted PhoX family phosphatase